MNAKTAMVTMVAVILCAGAASAGVFGQVDVKLDSISPKLTMGTWVVPYDSNWYTGATGQFNLSFSNPSAGVPELTGQGFCLEVETTGVGSTARYDVRDLYDAPVSSGPADTSGGPMLAPKAAAIAELWGRSIGEVVDNVSAAAFQLCVWELVYEDLYVALPPGWDVTSGKFKARDDGGNTTLAINQANAWLAEINGSGPFAQLVGLTKAGKQDFVTSVVPEPGTITVLLVGAASVCAVRRKREA